MCLALACVVVGWSVPIQRHESITVDHCLTVSCKTNCHYETYVSTEHTSSADSNYNYSKVKINRFEIRKHDNNEHC